MAVTLGSQLGTYEITASLGGRIRSERGGLHFGKAGELLGLRPRDP